MIREQTRTTNLIHMNTKNLSILITLLLTTLASSTAKAEIVKESVSPSQESSAEGDDSVQAQLDSVLPEWAVLGSVESIEKASTRSQNIRATVLVVDPRYTNAPLFQDNVTERVEQLRQKMIEAKAPIQYLKRVFDRGDEIRVSGILVPGFGSGKKAKMVWTGANRNWVDAVDAKSGLPVEGSAEHLELQRIIEKANAEDLQESARKFIEIVQKAGGFSIPGFGGGEVGVTSLTNAVPQNPAVSRTNSVPIVPLFKLGSEIQTGLSTLKEGKLGASLGKLATSF